MSVLDSTLFHYFLHWQNIKAAIIYHVEQSKGIEVEKSINTKLEFLITNMWFITKIQKCG